jgi:1,4-dihydroxy-2-naphthoate octaprenyltransferase
LWLLAARPKTLPAAIIPVLLGSTLALEAGQFRFAPAFLCLTFALLVQVATNFANDYFDAKQGADTPDRIGPTRAVASGLVAAADMRRAMIAVLVLAFLVGCALLPFGGWWLLPIGVLCLICAVAYTGGPYPLGYHGWGEVFVFLFFGLVATMLTFRLQAGAWTAGSASYVWPALWVAAVPGALATALIVVNNLRDRETDARAGKRTLAVRWGRRFSLVEYAGLHALALGSVLALDWSGLSSTVLLPWLLAPGAFWLCRRVNSAHTAAAWEQALVGTAAYLVAFGLLLAIGLCWANGG